MSVTDTAEELERVIAEHDLAAEHAERVRELAQEGVPVLDAIRQAAAEGETEEQPATPPAQASTELAEPTPAMLKRLAAETDRHLANVAKIMGGFVDGFVICDKCDALGLTEPAPPARTHEFYAACQTCNGYGQVLTGSLEQQYAAVACPDCLGRGYLEALLDNTPATAIVAEVREQRRTAVQQPVAVVQIPTPAAPAGELEYGRPAWMGDPSVGTP